jgi:hypothetical protein
MAGGSIDPNRLPAKEEGSRRASCSTRAASGDPDRRALLAAVSAGLCTSALPGRALGIGDHAKLRMARLHLPDLPNPRPSALRRLAWEIERRTSLVTVPDPVELKATDPELFRHPLLILSGDRGFAQPPEADVVRLRRFLTYGGFLLVDSAEGRAGGPFDESVRRLLQRLLPEDLPERVPDDHVLWKAFYVLRAPAGRILAAPYVDANDLGGALARDGFGRWEHEVIPGGEGQREQAFRFAINVVMYAMCLDYKAEQAHIDFILRTRRQR